MGRDTFHWIRPMAASLETAMQLNGRTCLQPVHPVSESGSFKIDTLWSSSVFWFVSLGYIAFQYLERAHKDAGEGLFIRDCSDRTRGNGFKLTQGKFRLDIRRKSLLWGIGMGCPRKLWMLHPWRCSRPGWTEPWVIWFSVRCPCPWQGGWN